MKCTKKTPLPNIHSLHHSPLFKKKTKSHLERIDGATPLPLVLVYLLAPLTYTPPFGEWLISHLRTQLQRRQPLAIFDLKMSSSPTVFLFLFASSLGAEVPWCPWSSSVPSLNHDAAVQDPGWCQGCIWPKWRMWKTDNKQQLQKHMFIRRKNERTVECVYIILIH